MLKHLFKRQLPAKLAELADGMTSTHHLLDNVRIGDHIGKLLERQLSVPVDLVELTLLGYSPVLISLHNRLVDDLLQLLILQESVSIYFHCQAKAGGGVRRSRTGLKALIVLSPKNGCRRPHSIRVNNMGSKPTLQLRITTDYIEVRQLLLPHTLVVDRSEGEATLSVSLDPGSKTGGLHGDHQSFNPI